MFKNSIFYTFEKISPKVISIFLLPILLRLIKPELWAEITLLLALQLLISYFLTQGDERSILKFTSEEELLYRAFTSLLRISILVLTIFEIVGYFFESLPFSLEYGLPFRFMFVSTVIISINKLLLAKLRSLEKSTEIFKSSFFESLFINSIQLLLVAITVQLDGYDSRVIVTVYFLVQLFGNLLKFFYFAKSIEFKLTLVLKNLLAKKPKDFLKFSNISFLILISNYFVNWQDKFFVEIIFGLKELGIYSVTTRISNLGLVFIGSILTAAYSKYWPKTIEDKTDYQVKQITGDIIIISSYSMATLMLIVVSVGQYVFPTSYEPSINMIDLATVLVFLQTIVLIFSIDLGRISNLKRIYFFNLSVIIVQVSVYNFYTFKNLEEIFILQIITMLIFIITFFWKTVLVFKKEFTISIFLVFITVLIATFYQSSDSQILQLSSFLLSLFFASKVFQRWVKLDSN